MTRPPAARPLKPINFDEATERGLVVPYPAKGISTFSNGTDWECWAARNCFKCRFYDPTVAGKYCAFESATFLHAVSPDLARLFGWTESGMYPGSFDRPHDCPFMRRRDENDGDGESVPPPFTDPAQLVLLADPTEDAAIIQNAPHETVRETAGAAR